MLVRKTEPFPVECVVRGYLAGSGWKDYQKSGRGVRHRRCRAGLRESDRLEQPLFTPSTKAETGHDENISFEQMSERRGGGPRGRAARPHPRALPPRPRPRRGAAGSSSPTPSSSSGRAKDAWSGSTRRFTPDSSRFWPRDALRARPRAAELRQAVRPRLPGDPGLGQAASGTPLTGRRGDPHAREVPRGLRAPHRHDAHRRAARRAGRSGDER